MVGKLNILRVGFCLRVDYHGGTEATGSGEILCEPLWLCGFVASGKKSIVDGPWQSRYIFHVRGLFEERCLKRPDEFSMKSL